MTTEDISKRKFSSEKCDNDQLVEEKELTDSKNEGISEQNEFAKRKVAHEECDKSELVSKEILADTENEGITDEQQEISKRKIPPEECDNPQPDKKTKTTDTENDLSQESVSKYFTFLPDNNLRFEPECKICHKKFFSARNYTQHVESAAHIKREKYRSYETYYCRPCNKKFYGLKSYNIHIKAKFHQRCMIIYKLHMQMKKKGNNNTGLIIGVQAYKCNACNKKLDNIIDFNDHMSSTAHKRTVQEIIMRERAYCQPCNEFFFKLKSYAEHLSTSRHLENAQ